MTTNLPKITDESTGPQHISAPPLPWGVTLAERMRNRRRKLRVALEVHEGQPLLVLTDWRKRGAAGWWPNQRQTIALSAGDLDAVGTGMAAFKARRRLPEAKP
jgi:hypothetical protein